MTAEEQQLRQRIAEEIRQRMMPICPMCPSCGTEAESYATQRVMEIVLQRHMTREEVLNGRSAH